MNSLLIHGCYDLKTLETLKKYGTKELAFDLRGRSSNLITYKDLLILLGNLTTERVFLTFGGDRKETILSYLNLLKNEPFSFTLIFRDHLDAKFYSDLGLPFYWMYHPEGDWQSIMNLPNAKGVLLPIKMQSHFQRLHQLWDFVDHRNLDVYLHAETFEETLFLNLGQEIKLSLDLSPEVEKDFRTIDQEKLKSMKIWRRLNENFAGQ